MNREAIEQALKQEYDYAAKNVLSFGSRMAAVPKVRAVLEALLTLPEAADVQYISIGSTWDKGISYVNLALRKKDSALVREAAKLLHVKFDKEQSGDGLECSAVLGDVILKISNYVPPSCHVEYADEWVPGHTAKKAKVICTEE